MLKMASKFIVSAPGKVILYGEHAAVYNKPAIAAAISLRTYLLVHPSADHGSSITLDFGDIGLFHVWDIDALPWDSVQVSNKEQTAPTAALNTALLEAIRPHAAAVAKHVPEEQYKIHVRSATAFLYLFLSLRSRESAGAVYTLRSHIPIGAGLGSSASVCVCWSAALLVQAGQVAHGKASEKIVELINRWAFVGEQCIHGNPSGVDNAVSARGQAVVYQKTASGPALITPIPLLPKLPIYLIDTQQARTTAVQVEKVRQGLCPETELILDKIGRLSEAALELILSCSDFDENGTAYTLENLGALISENHRLLTLLGVSHPRLDRVVEIVDEAGIGWTKLTGAGGGGCAITLFKPSVTDEVKRRLEKQLDAERYKLYKTSLGAKGVGFLDCSAANGNLLEDIVLEDVTAELVVEGTAQLRALEGSKDWIFW